MNSNILRHMSLLLSAFMALCLIVVTPLSASAQSLSRDDNTGGRLGSRTQNNNVRPPYIVTVVQADQRKNRESFQVAMFPRNFVDVPENRNPMGRRDAIVDSYQTILMSLILKYRNDLYAPLFVPLAINIIEDMYMFEVEKNAPAHLHFYLNGQIRTETNKIMTQFNAANGHIPLGNYPTDFIGGIVNGNTSGVSSWGLGGNNSGVNNASNSGDLDRIVNGVARRNAQP